MRHRIHTAIDISASKEEVWKALIDFNNYPNWNPFITSLSGELKIRESLHATIGTMRFKPVIQSLVPPNELVWLGRLLLPGIFDGRHSFELKDNGDGTMTFKHSEQFNGILVPFMRKKLNREITAGFRQMNEALKAHVEG